MANSTIPGIHFLNQFRSELHRDSFDTQQVQHSTMDKCISWLAHKILSVACIVVDTLAVATTLAAFTLISCPLGLLKIFIFAITAGKIALEFTTFANVLLAHTARAIADLFWSVIEPLGHFLYFFKTAYDVSILSIKWVGEKLHLDGRIVRWIQEHFKKTVEFIVDNTLGLLFRRLRRGFELASSTEMPSRFTSETIGLIRPLDALARACSIMGSEERSIGRVLAHYPLSVINTAANLAVGGVSLVAATAATVSYLAKVVIGAVTDQKLPLPTYIFNAWNVSLICARNIFYDVTSDLVDGFVLVFKLAQTLRINEIILSVGRLLDYCVQAIFS